MTARGTYCGLIQGMARSVCPLTSRSELGQHPGRAHEPTWLAAPCLPLGLASHTSQLLKQHFSWAHSSRGSWALLSPWGQAQISCLGPTELQRARWPPFC